MLHRSRAFAAEGGAPVEILTFDNFRDYTEIRKTLAAQGKLGNGVSLRNIWEELPDLAGSIPIRPDVELNSFTPLGASGQAGNPSEGVQRRKKQRFAADGITVLQTDHLRDDGSLFLSDRNDVDNPGKPGGRSLTLCDFNGLPVEQWTSAWGMYRFWMDHLTAGEESYFVVDNKHAATFMKTYRRPSATVMLMVHDSHLAHAAAGPTTPLNGSGEVLIPRFDGFDGVAILTEMQADDVKARLGDTGNMFVIPNSRALETGPIDGFRDESAGVLLAQLRPLKQIDHAIRAVAEARRNFASPVTLDIYGEGAEGPALQALIDRMDVASVVRLKGHTHTPAAAFRESSFSLLTSSSESFGLVILESMSAGCVPIAYDTHYGPSSIINHGVNGFIVEYGNERAMAECIASFMALTVDQKVRLREAAIARAADFADAPVVAMWSAAFTKAAARKALQSPELKVSVIETACGIWSDGALEIRISADLRHNAEVADEGSLNFYCRLQKRGTDLFFRTAGQFHDPDPAGGSTRTITFRFSREIVSAIKDSIVDVTMESHLLGSRVSTRLPAGTLSTTSVEPYATVHGNLSLRPVNAAQSHDIPVNRSSRTVSVNNPDERPERQLPNVPSLPGGYHCSVTWGIPTEFGGMTSALLHRSRAFIREAGIPVDVLTFAWSLDYSDVRCQLEMAGELIPGLRLRNLWEELCQLTEDQLHAPKPGRTVVADFAPIGAHEDFFDEVSGGYLRRRIRYASDQKTELQVDYFRPDGSLVVADRRDIETKGTLGGRLVTLCGLDGSPVASWNQIWPLYLFWLDRVVAARKSFMIIDSKSTANFMTRYRRDNVVTMHLVHNSHMASGAVPPYGELSPTRKYVFERLSSFDSVVFLTESQKKDVDLVLDSPENTCVIPNSRPTSTATQPEQGHNPQLGVILGSLNGRKRIDHAVRALAEARESSGVGYMLDIYGQGPDRAALQRLIKRSGLEGHATLRGYAMGAREEFARASFTLLTSTLEGQGLVLIEAMSAGCIPISYDIPYGPADIIEDGVNGFLVAAGDVSAMAEKIRQIGSMNPDVLQGMRRAAVARAQEFNDERVVMSWGKAMREAADRKLLASSYSPVA